MADLPDLDRMPLRQLRGTMGVRHSALTYVSLAGVCFISSAHLPAYGWEWNGKCGTSSSALQTCRIKKGDAVLKGEVGTLYTYTLPSGQAYERFMPTSSRGRACQEEGLMREAGKSWFPIRSICVDSLIIHELPTGNRMLVELYDSP